MTAHMSCRSAGSTGPAKSILPTIPHMSDRLRDVGYRCHRPVGDAKHRLPLRRDGVGRVTLGDIGEAPVGNLTWFVALAPEPLSLVDEPVGRSERKGTDAVPLDDAVRI